MKKTPRRKIRAIRNNAQSGLLVSTLTCAARIAGRHFMTPLLLSTMFSLFAVCAFSQERALAPAFKDGDFWQFKVTEHLATNVSSTKALDGVYELVYSQGKVKGFLLAGDHKGEVDLDPDDHTGTLLVLLGLNPKRPDLRFPLSVGQKWNYAYQFKTPGTRMVHPRNVDVSVAGIESVSIQAGTFRAFRILVETNWSSGGRGPKVDSKVNRTTTTYFYSAESKSIIKSGRNNSLKTSNETKSGIELVKFGSENESR